MHVVVDIGNTKIAMGVYLGDSLTCHWTMKTDRMKTVDEYALFISQMCASKQIDPLQVEGIMICSVVPEIDRKLAHVMQQCFRKEALFVGPGVKTGLNILYENPREVGADRITNAVAGVAYYGSPLLVIDFGTATTYCYINAKKQYVGGAILPGIDISMDSLHARTSKLPQVDTLGKARSVIGKSTIQAIQSGYLYGFVSQTEGMITRMLKEAGEQAFVLATGPHAMLMKEELPSIHAVDDYLTFKGLHLLFTRNHT
ncbi:type III pantothenate kinase [Paenalkalicoccus suaedae]|uniref:Type III pantothenate kinase n=1 Tax=Paenalkalicoccus suaedae TaxID=2592382 RepID=A0A859F9B8_9BACI|nr:type III pantothenate kinase [Paenalkalicoccus suaedae]QKS69659.1 type III pantothenate kinase [Paenalkalicoccus suaedae]